MPTIIIPDKICPHCGGDKWFQSSFKSRSKYKDKDKIFIRYMCYIKVTEGNNRWKTNNKFFVVFKGLFIFIQKVFRTIHLPICHNPFLHHILLNA